MAQRLFLVLGFVLFNILIFGTYLFKSDTTFHLTNIGLLPSNSSKNEPVNKSGIPNNVIKYKPPLNSNHPNMRTSSNMGDIHVMPRRKIFGSLADTRYSFMHVSHISRNGQDPFKSTMSDKDKSIMKDLMETFVDTITKAGIEYFMYGGTLLGSYRHHGPIPWDDDQDLFLPAAKKHTLSDAISKLNPTYSLATNQKYRWKFYSSKSRSIRGVKWKYPFLDICFYKENTAMIWDEDPLFGKTFKFENNIVFPLIKRPFWGMMLYSPKNTLAFLKTNYAVDVCESNRYSHKFEKWVNSKVGKVPCSALYPRFPFVFRKNSLEGIQEILRVGRNIVSTWLDTSTNITGYMKNKL